MENLPLSSCVVNFEKRVGLRSFNQISVLQSDNVLWSVFADGSGSSLSGCAQVNTEEVQAPLWLGTPSMDTYHMTAVY